MTVAITIFRVLSSCTSMCMMLSPMPLIVHSCRTKSTGYASIVPLVSMLTNITVLIIYGYLTEQYFPVFATFLVGWFLALSYVSLFYRYSHEKSKAHKVFLGYGIPLFCVVTYAVLGSAGVTHQTRHQVGDVVGYVTILTGIIVFSSPLEKVGPVLKHRSAVFLPIHMVCAGTINNLMWTCYGALTWRWILLVPNAISLVSGCFQLVLYAIFYPATHPITSPDALTASDSDDKFDLEAGRHDTSSTAIDDTDKDDFVELESPRSPTSKTVELKMSVV